MRKKIEKIAISTIVLVLIASTLTVIQADEGTIYETQDHTVALTANQTSISIGEPFNISVDINQDYCIKGAKFTVNFTNISEFVSGWKGNNHIWNGDFFDLYTSQSNDTGDGTGTVNYTSSGITCEGSAGQGAVYNFTSTQVGACYVNFTYMELANNTNDKKYLSDMTTVVNEIVYIYPCEPAALGATMWNHTAINLTFTPGSGGPFTTVCGKAGSYPTGPTDSLLYNGTGSSFDHEGLNPCTKYWYKAWTWNETEKLHSVYYRQAYATTDCYTNFSFSGEEPTDASTTTNGVYDIPVNVTIVNSAGHTYEVWINTSVGALYHHGPGLTNGSRGATMYGLDHNTLYYWNVTVTDGNGDTTYANYTFTTGVGGGGSPDQPDNPNPANHAPSIPVNLGLFEVGVSDPDGDAINTTFKWINGTVIGYDDVTPSGGTASISPTLLLSYGTVYQWYVIASDGILSTQSPTWDFTTDIVSVQTTKEWTAYNNNSVQVWLNISNNGQTNLTNILITETYDANLVFVSSNPTNNSGHDNQWTIPYLNMTGYSGHWYNITIWLNLTGAFTNGDTLGNSVKSTILGVDNVTTMGDSDKLTVGFTITKESNVTYWDANETYTYWLNVTNTGDFTLHNIWINETYSSNLTYVSNSSAPVADDSTHGNNSWMWNTLTPGSTIVVTIIVNATGANGSLVSNTVDIATMEGPSGQDTLDTYIGVATTQLRITYSTPLGSLLSGSYSALLLVLILGMVLAAVAIMYVVVKLRKASE